MKSSTSLRKVAASTQNQAFNAILFLYRHILKKDFGDHKDIPRAKRSNYIPVVLTRNEIDAALKHLTQPHNLVVNLRTIQEMPGHADVRTTMIYTHCVPSKTMKERKSPLDF